MQSNANSGTTLQIEPINVIMHICQTSNYFVYKPENVCNSAII